MSKLGDVGIRLRFERERAGMNQTDFAAIAEVTRGSQQGYELGQRPFPISYLLALEPHGVDIVFILTGKRSAETLTSDQAQLLTAYEVLGAPDRKAALRILCSAAGIAAPLTPIDLPSPEALEDAMSALLDEAAEWSPADFVHELAISLPTLIHAAADEIGDPPSDRLGNPSDSSTAPHAAAVSKRRSRSI